MDVDDDSLSLVPPEMVDTANIATSSTLPEKSKRLYEKTYAEFILWCKKKNVTCYSESVLLVYFSDVVKRGLKASLWPKYSMLKTTLNVKKNIDISNYNKLIMFIKRQKEGYKPRKSKVLEKEQIQKFIFDAPNSLYLMTKVALIFGVAGAMRREEFLKLEIGDVQDLETKFLVTIRTSKTNRLFTIVNKEEQTLIRHYISLRPPHTRHKRFFIYYKNNRCSTEPIGINTFAKLPSRIATFLSLEQPHLYTGHCFRRSSASVLTDTGVEFPAVIKRHNEWKPAAERSVENSIENVEIKCENLEENSNFGSIKVEPIETDMDIKEEDYKPEFKFTI